MLCRRIYANVASHGPHAPIAKHAITKTIKGDKFPLVLMLEPLLRCNLACPGCGKIDYPDAILNRRLSFQDCMDAIEDCGAPAVSIAGGEPLLHREMAKIVKGYIERKKFVILCTNALLLKKKIGEYEPSPYFTWSIHLDGDKQMHDKAVDRTAPMTSLWKRSSWPSPRVSAFRSTAPSSTMRPLRAWPRSWTT
jgi:hopanoid biosynthesis associated radical SAM protein HpnH